MDLILEWNYRFLVDADFYEPSNFFYFVLRYHKEKKYIGEAKIRCTDLFTDANENHTFNVLLCLTLLLVDWYSISNTCYLTS